MNFLTHSHLADQVGADLLGAILPDYVKPGPDGYARFPSAVASSCRLHQAIDAAAESLPAMRLLQDHFRPACHHYAGIVVDIACDHVLARDWSRYAEDDLATFEVRCYRAYRRVHGLVPAIASRILGFERHRVLSAYAEENGLRRSLVRVGCRVRGSFPVGRLLAEVIAVRKTIATAYAGIHADLLGVAHSWLGT